MTYSAHMVQHVILAQLVPLPLAITVGGRCRRFPAALAWILGVGIMIGTSLPPAYLLVAREGLAADGVIAAALVIGGTVFWTPVFGGARETRLAPGSALMYLITACFATTLAGVYIAFSAASFDQQVAGLIMWVPCCIVYLSASLAVVVRALQSSSPTVTRRIS